MASFDSLSPEAKKAARRHIVMSIWRHGEVTAAMLTGPIPLEEDDEFLADWATNQGISFDITGKIIPHAAP